MSDRPNTICDQGSCPISGCNHIFAKGFIGIDAHVKSISHAKDFPRLSGKARYDAFRERYPRATWKSVKNEIPSSSIKAALTVDDDTKKAESYQSTYLEKLTEHLFISQLLQYAWTKRRMMVDVLRSEIDANGHDLVLESGGVIRHVQLKASRSSAKTKEQKINSKLADKPAGCVVWILRLEIEDRFDLTYLYFGGKPNEPLPLSPDLHRLARHTKANRQGVKAIRPAIHVIPRRDFHEVPKGISGLIDLLFGAPASSSTMAI